jgi:redox-sensing transcriptional repressor
MDDQGSADRNENEAPHGFRPDAVPAPAVRRLSLYLRELEGLLVRGYETTSSKKLGQLLGLTDAQVRKDLAYFGQFGHPGIGYRIDELVARLKHILGTDRTWNALLVGVGYLGSALLSYRGFDKKGFRVVAAFDTDPSKVGRAVGGDGSLTIQPMDELVSTVERLNIQMAIVAVPAGVAQQVADQVVTAGIRGILNFAPAALSVPPDVGVAAVDLAVHLEQLAFRIGSSQESPSP